MKTLLLGFGILTLFNCNASKTNANDSKIIDGRLTGKWSMAFDNASITRSRTITRDTNGKFVANNVTKIQGRVQRYQTSGMWWTDKAFYYETNSQSGDTLKYKFRIENASKVTFEKEPNTEEDYKYSEIKE